jgi:predicted GIY-YIG superfamily endonuclease
VITERVSKAGVRSFAVRLYRGSGQYEWLGTHSTRERAEEVEAQAKVRKRHPVPARPGGDHWLYRCFDGAGALLYVGVTSDGPKRFRRHGNDREWWPQVARIDIEHFTTKEELLRAETKAIRQERPRHNTLHRAGQPKRVEKLYRRCGQCGQHYRPPGWCGCRQADAHAEAAAHQRRESQERRQSR